MNSIVVASSEADATAVEQVKEHHAQLSGALTALVRTLITAVDERDPATVAAARARLAHWCETELVPHALAEERAMYPLAHEDDRARLLVDAMLAEHRVIVGLVEQLGGDLQPAQAAGTAEALRVLFESHLAKENDQVLPLLAAAPSVSLGDVLAGMHELQGGGSAHHGGEPHAHEEEGGGGCGGTCGCGEQDPVGVLPELDARTVPHAIRHATIFGALDAVRPGGGLVLVAPHDPLPLLRQLEGRAPGVFEVDYLERGPESWRLRFVRP